jgi:hypothetical protein
VSMYLNMCAFISNTGYRKIVTEQHIFPNDLAIGGWFTFTNAISGTLVGNGVSWGMCVTDDDADYLGWHVGKGA